VNGQVASLGDRADPERDEVKLDGERLRLQRPDYWLVNKPVGVVTTVRDPEGRRTILDLLPQQEARLFPVGRLDRDTAGLVILTNDGDLTQALLHPSKEIDREYEVSVKGELDDRACKRLERGIRLEDGWTAPARVTRVRYDAELERTQLHLTLREGRKRQIRRSLRSLGHPVVALRRIRMGPIRLGRLAPGEARRLDAGERAALAKLVRRETRTDSTSRQRRGNAARKARPRKGKPGGSRKHPG